MNKEMVFTINVPVYGAVTVTATIKDDVVTINTIKDVHGTVAYDHYKAIENKAIRTIKKVLKIK